MTTPRATNAAITADMSVWGNNSPYITDSVLKLINASPTLQAEINNYQNMIDNGGAAPIFNPNPGDISATLEQTGYFNDAGGVGLQIQMDTARWQQSATGLVGDLAYEFGHFVNYSNDQQLYNSLANLNPNDPAYAVMAGIVGEYMESESLGNNAKVQQEILQSLAGQSSSDILIKINGDSNVNGAYQNEINALYASNPTPTMQNIQSVTLQTLENSLTKDDNGNSVTFAQLYAENPVALHNDFDPSNPIVGVWSTPAPDVNGVALNFNNSTGALSSATIYLPGSNETLKFANQTLSSSTFTDEQGNITATVTYVRNGDGSYSATYADSSGTVTSTQTFNSNGSESLEFSNPNSIADVNAPGVVLTTNAETVDINGSGYDTTILNGNHVINAQAGDTFQLTGVGYNVNLSATGAASTVTFEANSGGAVNGNNSRISEATGDNVGAYGGGDTINATAGSLTYVANTNGSYDNVTVTGDAFGGTVANGQGTGVWLATNAQANVYGNNNGISLNAGDSMGAFGGANTINAAAGSVAYVANTNGSYDIVNTNGDVFGGTAANGQGTGIWMATNAQANVYGNNNGISLNAGDSMGAFGGANTINAAAGSVAYVANTNGSYDIVNTNGDVFGGTAANGQGTGVWLATNAQANVYGNNNGISLNAGDSMGAFGGANTINAAAGSVAYVANTNGSYDIVNTNGDVFGGTAANGQGTGIWLATNAQANVYGNNNGISLNAGDSMGAYGGGDTINATADSLTYVANTNGSYDNVNVTGDTFGGTVANGQGTGVWLATNAQANVDGNNNGITVNAGDSMGAYGGGDTINATADSLTYVANTNGSYDNVNVTGDAFGGTVANGQGTGVWLATNVQANVDGSHNGITVNSGDSVGAYGGGDTINATAGSLTYIADTSGSADTINASSDSFGGKTANGQDTGIWISASSQANVYGSNDGISLDGGNTIDIDGQQDHIDGNGDTIDFSGSTAGDIVTGINDSGSGWSGVDYINVASPSGGDGGSSDGSGDDGGGGDLPPPDEGDPGASFGFAGNRQTINAELGQGAAQFSSLEQKQGVSAGAIDQGLAQATEMSTDAVTSAGNSANVLEGARWSDPTVTWSLSSTNGTFDQAEQRQVEQAFATWAAASGLQFVEVSSPSQADINIGWGNLNTSQTGAVGLTTYNSSKGVFSAGTQIQLESSTQDVLTAGSNGSLIYSGTDATFSQTVLHEIGHALGLAENADATSIMNYDLTSSNQTLDQTDRNAIQALYGSSAETSALIQAMAGTPPSASSTTSLPAEQTSQHVQLLAGAH
ncbi:hypothetical protein D1006_14785 [Burkholderia stabilis]|uniref:Peptidase metallopeptidase domain-containing protein n=1 Tax=Burkholderia stabilis TaxID=95485 RepID=A0A4Q2AWL6_9BURK|nr:matrixin family metalloprotease [Burkholderia stabilis]RXV73471.1 hypothetical protein D1006_14785 [Burkholderia stabilis]